MSYSEYCLFLFSKRPKQAARPSPLLGSEMANSLVVFTRDTPRNANIANNLSVIFLGGEPPLTRKLKHAILSFTFADVDLFKKPTVFYNIAQANVSENYYGWIAKKNLQSSYQRLSWCGRHERFVIHPNIKNPEEIRQPIQQTVHNNLFTIYERSQSWSIILGTPCENGNVL